MRAFNRSTRRSASDSNRAFYWALSGVLVLHTFLLFLPWLKMDGRLTSASQPLHVQFIGPPLEVETVEPASIASTIPEVAPAEPPGQPVPAAVSEAPDAVPAVPSSPIPEPKPVTDEPSLPTRILASPYLEEESTGAKLFSTRLAPDQAESVFHFRERPTMVSALNSVPDQLPFGNGPRFVVASYDPGVIGDVQRFFDAVTLEKEWVTKNGTRVKCAWVLILAGCGWD